MAITVDRLTNVISIPQSDCSLITGTLYELDTDWFRLQLKAIEASEEGIVFDDMHDHNSTYTVAGITYAQKVEIINGFMVEFTPDAQWSCRLAGSNNNLFDVENGILVQNQVQVIPGNSAGLIIVAGGGGEFTEAEKKQIRSALGIDGTKVPATGGQLQIIASDIVDLPDNVWEVDPIDHQSADTFGALLGVTLIEDVQQVRFMDGVFLSNDWGVGGTDYDKGTRGNPVNNVTDARTLLGDRNSRKLTFIDNAYYALGTSNYYDHYFVGECYPLVGLGTGQYQGSKFYQCYLINGGNTSAVQGLFECIVGYGTFAIEGAFRTFIIDQFTLQGGCTFMDCRFDCANFNAGTSGTATFVNCSGNIVIKGVTSSSLYLNDFRGKITLASSCTAGYVTIRGGAGVIVDNSAGTVVTVEGFVNDEMIATSVYEAAYDDYQTPDTFGGAFHYIAETQMQDLTDMIWDELLAGHAIVGSAGAALTAAAGGGDPAAVAQAVWEAAFSGYNDPTQMGFLMNKYLRALIIGDAKQDQANKQWVVYDPDDGLDAGMTELARHDTLDENNQPANIAIYTRKLKV